MLLTVDRKAFNEAVALAAGPSRGAGCLMLSFMDGLLFFQCGDWRHGIPARGEGPEEIIVRTSWARKLHRRPLAANPIHLRVEDERLYAETFSQSCAFLSTIDPFDPMLYDPRDKIRLQKAAQILAPLLVSEADLRSAIDDARERPEPLWREEEIKSLRVAADAWVVLAPMGVTTDDLKHLIDKASRHAWDNPNFRLASPRLQRKNTKRARK